MVAADPRELSRRVAAKCDNRPERDPRVPRRLFVHDPDRQRYLEAAREARRAGRRRHLVGSHEFGLFARPSQAERVSDAHPILGKLDPLEARARQHLCPEAPRQSQRRDRPLCARPGPREAAARPERRCLLRAFDRQYCRDRGTDRHRSGERDHPRPFQLPVSPACRPVAHLRVRTGSDAGPEASGKQRKLLRKRIEARRIAGRSDAHRPGKRGSPEGILGHQLFRRECGQDRGPRRRPEVRGADREPGRCADGRTDEVDRGSRLLDLPCPSLQDRRRRASVLQQRRRAQHRILFTMPSVAH